MHYKFDVRGSVHHSTIHKQKSNKMQQCIKFFVIPYLYETQHVSGDTPPIIRNLKLHVVRHSVPDKVHQLHVQQLSHI
jgi:hypothetical protein